MHIEAHEDNTGYAPPACRWHAIDADTYDGAPDTLPPSSIGYGATAAEGHPRPYRDHGGLRRDHQRRSRAVAQGN